MVIELYIWEKRLCMLYFNNLLALFAKLFYNYILTIKKMVKIKLTKNCTGEIWSSLTFIRYIDLIKGDMFSTSSYEQVENDIYINDDENGELYIPKNCVEVL